MRKTLENIVNKHKKTPNERCLFSGLFCKFVLDSLEESRESNLDKFLRFGFLERLVSFVRGKNRIKSRLFEGGLHNFGVL